MAADLDSVHSEGRVHSLTTRMPLSNPLIQWRLIRRTQAIRQHSAWAYGIAVGIVVAAVVLRYTLNPWLSAVGVPYLTFYPAVILATFLGGLGPGLITLTLCAIAAW